MKEEKKIQKVNNFGEMINYIRNEIMEPEWNDLQITIYNDGVYFHLYETFDLEIAVDATDIYNAETNQTYKKNTVKFKTEFISCDVTTDEMEEVSRVMEFIEHNIDVVEELINKKL